MDLLQVALIFLVILLSIFLAITGFQVFLILRDLKKALDKLNTVLKTGENIASDIEKPVASTAEFLSTLTDGAKTVIDAVSKKPKSHVAKQKRFFKKVL